MTGEPEHELRNIKTGSQQEHGEMNTRRRNITKTQWEHGERDNTQSKTKTHNERQKQNEKKQRNNKKNKEHGTEENKYSLPPPDYDAKLVLLMKKTTVSCHSLGGGRL